MTLMMPKILIGIVTHDGHKDMKTAFFRSLHALQCPSETVVDTLIVDTSDSGDYSHELRDAGYPVLRLPPMKRTRIKKILDGRNMIREAFLHDNHTHLFFLDSDIMLQPNYLVRLFSHGKDVVSGVYLGNIVMNGKDTILPVLYVFHDKSKGLLRRLTHEDVVADQLLEIGAAGLGCVLVSRKAMESVPDFHLLVKSATGGEDAVFFKDVYDKNISMHCDTGVKCLHMVYPEGDRRNALFQFKKASLNYSYSSTVSFG